MIGIIFDCDGTLVDSEQAHLLSWQATLQQFGRVLNVPEYMALAGQSGTIVSQKLQQKFQLDSAEEILDHKNKAFEALQKKGMPPVSRTLKFVRQLIERKPQGIFKLAVASAASKSEILAHLESLDLLPHLEIIVSGKDDLDDYEDPQGVNKPQPYIYLHTAKLLGISPSQCVAFEDSGPGLLAAVRAGMITFAVPNSITLHHNFSQASYVIDPQTEIDPDDFFMKIDQAMAVR